MVDERAEISCETQGHFWGPLGKCVFCETPKPAEAKTSNPVNVAWLEETKRMLATTWVPSPAKERLALAVAEIERLRSASETEAPQDTMYTLKLQCQALWRTDITLVCCLPKGHEGIHKARNGWTFTGECVASPEKTSCESGPPSDDPNVELNP